MTPCLKWLLRARPADYALALSVAGASLPVVRQAPGTAGRRDRDGRLGRATGPRGLRRTEEGLADSRINDARRRDRESTLDVSVAALRGVVSAADLDLEWPVAEKTPPIWEALRQRRYLYRRAVHYGDHPAQVLDVWRRKDLPAQPAPVLIFVPGGAWVHGRSMMQGTALMSRLAEMGWVCLAIDYRVAPYHRWPRHITDVKTAIAWARANVDKFGGDRDFVAVAGCSAGGHLSALAGLTPDDPQFERKLPEGADSSVDAVVGIYGRYDWEDRSTPERDRFVEFLERVVVKKVHRPSPRGIPRCVADRACAPKCSAVLGDSRQQGQRHSRRAGSQLRRAAAGRLAFDGRLPGAARGGTRLRPDRR